MTDFKCSHLVGDAKWLHLTRFEIPVPMKSDQAIVVLLASRSIQLRSYVKVMLAICFCVVYT